MAAVSRLPAPCQGLAPHRREHSFRAPELIILCCSVKYRGKQDAQPRRSPPPAREGSSAWLFGKVGDPGPTRRPIKIALGRRRPRWIVAFLTPHLVAPLEPSCQGSQAKHCLCSPTFFRRRHSQRALAGLSSLLFLHTVPSVFASTPMILACSFFLALRLHAASTTLHSSLRHPLPSRGSDCRHRSSNQRRALTQNAPDQSVLGRIRTRSASPCLCAYAAVQLRLHRDS